MHRVEFVHLVPRRNDSARFHVRSGDALHPAVETNAVSRARERRGGRRFVAEMRFKRAIARDVVPQLRCIGPERIDCVSDRWKRLPVNRYRLGGVLGLRFSLRDDHDDRFSDEACAVNRQRPLSGDYSLGSVAMDKRHIRPDLRTAGRMRNCL